MSDRQTGDAHPSRDVGELRLAAELAAMQHLQHLSTRLLQEHDVDAFYQQLLDGAVGMMRADMGSMQLLHAETNRLELIASQGLHAESVAVWQWVDGASCATACSAALRAGQRVVIRDVDACDFIVGTADHAAFRASGIRAVQSTPLLSRSGRVLGMISTHWRDPHEPSEQDLRLLDVLARQAADLIQRAQHEQVLRASEKDQRALAESLEVERRWLEAVLASLPVGVWIADSEGRLIDKNDTADRIWRGDGPLLQSPREYDSYAAWDADSGRRLQPEEYPLARALASGRAVEPVELNVRRFDDTEGVVLVSASPVRDADGRLLGAVGVNLDITERKRTEAEREAARAALAVQSRFLEATLSSIPDFVCAFDRDRRFVYVNRAMERLLGLTASEMRGKSFADLGYPPDLAARLDAHIDHIFHTGETVEDEIFYTSPIGVSGFFEFIWGPVTAEDDSVELVVGVSRDTTERRRLEERLREADRRKDEFLAMLSHELRNPLAPIAIAVQLLKADPERTPAQQQVTGVIERQLTHVIRLVDDLLEVSRITTGRIQLRREPIALHHSIERAVEMMRPLVDEHGHRLEVSMTRDPIRVVGDGERLTQVVVNLLANAVKYTPKGGRIVLAVEARDGQATVRVKDSGVGIPPEVLPKVFEPFVQGQQGLARSEGGLGIGLTLVRSLAELHGGAVEAHSAGEGQGSEFVVRLPVTSEPERPAPVSDLPKTRSMRPLRVLLVEDNVDMARMLGALLERSGHEVRCAHTGPDGLELSRGFRPEAALLDVGLPGMDGYEVARRMRQHEATQDAVLIALTGYGVEADRARSRAAGFDHHLTKPADIDVLERVLAEVGDAKRRAATA